jgi:hypothetical protein
LAGNRVMVPDKESRLDNGANGARGFFGFQDSN